MKNQRFFIFIFFIFLVSKSSSQGFLLTQPRLEIDGNQLSIFYDIITSKSADKLYLWVEITKANGEIIPAKTISGDLGEFVDAGNNKKIIWSPEQDSVYLNEEIFVELKAEKYIRSFHKGSMMLLSTVFPGWGQTKISKGKPWWLTGVTTYGALTGGYLFHQSYLKSHDSYKIEEDPVKRADLLDQSQKQLNFSNAMIYSAASLWAVNVLWVAFTPNRYQPLQHVKLSLNPSYSPNAVNPVLLSIRLDF